MYSVEFSDVAKKQFYKLPKEIQQRIVAALERIRIRPEAYIIKLVGIEGYKLRVGDYRLILDIEQQKLIIFVIKAGHRKNMYD
jgi:mRNA interferase RelE/StbE